MKRITLFLAASLISCASTVLAGGPFTYTPVVPCRIVDTRGPNGPTGGPILPASTARDFPIATYCSIPSTATAVTLTATMVGPTQNGYLTIWPYGTARPLVSNINASANETAIANSVYVPISPNQPYSLSVVYGTGNGQGSTHVLLDVTGFFR